MTTNLVANERALLERLLGQPLLLRLYVNDHTPHPTDEASDYVEMVGLGYAAKILIPEEWDYAPGNPTIAVYPEQTWTFTGGDSVRVYGYEVAQATDGRHLWGERFLRKGTVPIDYLVVQNEGDQISIRVPQLSLGNLR